MSGLVIDGFAGPGGWSVAMRELGLTEVGIELDAAACATRAAAGHLTIRADVSQFPAEHLAGKVAGVAFSPPCVFFSSAGTRAGIAVIGVLADGIRDAFAGRKTRALRRREMAAVLRKAGWPDPKAPRSASYARMPRCGKRRGKRQVIQSPGRGDAIRKAVLSASLVIEPARFIAACRPGWVVLEQVPDVLPLWQVYAEELRKLGYSTWCGKVNAADYGVPQTRERAILIASRVRTVRRPVPTHYDARKGLQLFGTPWVSMAEALGMGATARPAPTVTAGGTSTGGAEPFGHRDRGALEAERDAGRWVLGGPYRSSPGDRTRPRGMDEPATTVAFGHSGMVFPEDHAGVPEGDAGKWMLHTNRDQRPDGSRQAVGASAAPAPTVTAKSGGQWHLRMDTQAKATYPRPVTEPAPTIQFAHRANLAAWVCERPSTTVQGDPRIGRPGHKERESGGESQFAVDSVRVSVEEAAALQSFPPGYPWAGTKTARYTQVGNAWCPLAAIAVVGEATGADWQLVAAAYSARCYAPLEAEAS